MPCVHVLPCLSWSARSKFGDYGRSPLVPVPVRPAGFSTTWWLSKPVLAGGQRRLWAVLWPLQPTCALLAGFCVIVGAFSHCA